MNETETEVKKGFKPIAEIPPAIDQLDNLRLTADAMVAEVVRQDTLARRGKFGDYHVLPGGPHEWRLSVLLEEVGEVARELNEGLIRGPLDYHALIKELIQAGACCLSWATAAEHERVEAGQ